MWMDLKSFCFSAAADRREVRETETLAVLSQMCQGDRCSGALLRGKRGRLNTSRKVAHLLLQLVFHRSDTSHCCPVPVCGHQGLHGEGLRCYGAKAADREPGQPQPRQRVLLGLRQHRVRPGPRPAR